MKQCVLKNWVLDLPLRAQGSLLTCIRSCDLSPKTPAFIEQEHGCSTGEGSVDRQMVAWLRWVILNAADPREIDAAPGAWMQTKLPRDWKPSQFGHWPLHWYGHLMHAFEIVAYCHPYQGTRNDALGVYTALAANLHLSIESRPALMVRLNKDRIATGNVVS